jgi:hypothetical protein
MTISSIKQLKTLAEIEEKDKYEKYNMFMSKLGRRRVMEIWSILNQLENINIHMRMIFTYVMRGKEQ